MKKKAAVNDGATRSVFIAVICLFFASGLSSLIYQVVWTRMLVLVFGATTFATSTVLAVFMGGLALGSFIAARLADRIKRPLLWYGLLEAVIGVWALITPALFSAAIPLYKTIWLQTHASIVPFSLLRFVCTGAILLVPTTCMGATLPLLSKFVTTQLQSVGSRVGNLYASNTLGAVTGGLLAGFVFIPLLGQVATIIIAAAINVLLLLAVIGLNRVAVPAVPGDGGSPTTAQTEAGSRPPLPISVVVSLVAFAISGGIAMTYEVCWTRALLMVVGSSTYAFTIMLSAFLTGIFIGSVICARFIDKVKQPLLLFAGLQIVLGLATFVSMREFAYVPIWSMSLHPTFMVDELALMLLRFFLSGVVLIPITLCLGAMFPAIVKGCTTDLAAVGRSVGSLYSVNTCGAICGAFLAGFVFVPMFGVEKTMVAGAWVNALLGILVLCAAVSMTPRTKATATVGALAAMSLAVFFAGQWDPLILINTQSVKRNLLGRSEVYSYEEWKKGLHDNYDLKYWADGPCSNVAIVYSKKNKATSLLTNGHVDASDSGDMPVQALLAGFPLLLHPDAKDIAIVGWGAGQTVTTATAFPVRLIEAVELEPNVITASKFFHHVNHAPENDPRVKIQINDGRNYLLATDQKFDVIISEPSNPWQAGVCNLFTREYFEVCRQSLKPNCLFSLWLQISEVPPSDVTAVLAAMRQTFPNLVAFFPRSENLVVVGGQQPIKISVPEVQKVLADPKVKQELSRVGINSAADLLAHLAVTTNGAAALTSASPINTDDRNQLEFDVGKSYESRLFNDENKKLIAGGFVDVGNLVDWGDLPGDQRAKIMEQAALNAGGANDFRRAIAWATQSLALQPNNVALRLARGQFLLRLNEGDRAREDFMAALHEMPTNKDARYLAAVTNAPLLNGQPYTAEELAAGAGDTASKVLALLQNLPEDAAFAKTRPGIYLLAGHANVKLGNIKRAKELLDRYFKLEPGSAAGNELAGQISRAQSK